MIEQTECAICLQSLENNTSELNCKHIFHTECISCLSKRECPCCRGEITSPDEVVQNINKKIIKNMEIANSYFSLYLFPQLVIDVYNYIVGNEPSLNSYLSFDEGDRNRYNLRLNFSYHLGRNIVDDFIFSCFETDGVPVSNNLDVIRTFNIFKDDVLILSQEYTIREFLNTIIIYSGIYDSDSEYDLSEPSPNFQDHSENEEEYERSRSPSPE
jgi:hypothetical protein